ncbi:MAG: hypothetical protein GY765_35710 [bacterium]|nr:hypothetical protein [bacterium]
MKALSENYHIVIHGPRQPYRLPQPLYDQTLKDSNYSSIINYNERKISFFIFFNSNVYISGSRLHMDKHNLHTTFRLHNESSGNNQPVITGVRGLLLFQYGTTPHVVDKIALGGR